MFLISEVPLYEIPYSPKCWISWHVSLGNSLSIQIVRTRIIRGLQISIFHDRWQPMNHVIWLSESDKLEFLPKCSMQRRPSPTMSKLTFITVDLSGRRKLEGYLKCMFRSGRCAFTATGT